MIEVHGEVDQNHFNSEVFQGSQISNQQCYSFFKVIDNLNNSKFNTTAWFKFQAEKKFEYDEDYKKPIILPTEFKWLLKYNWERLINLSLIHINKVAMDMLRVKNTEDEIIISDAFIYIMKLAATRSHYQRLNLFEYSQEEVRKWIEISKRWRGRGNCHPNSVFGSGRV
jgi:hypothetical protein